MYLTLIYVQINDAVRIFQEKAPWKLQHCWEKLRFEPKWNAKMAKAHTSTKSQKTTHPETEGENSVPLADQFPARPEGRDNAKKRKNSTMPPQSESSAAVEMLQKIHERAEQTKETERKQKEELVNLAKAKFQLLQDNMKMKAEDREWSRHLTEEQLRIKKVQAEASLFQTESQIMFTDLNTLLPPIRDWVTKKTDGNTC